MAAERKIRVLEFYSGIGGLHCALKEAAIEAEVIGAVEINTVANELYSHNFPDTPVLNRSIESLSVKEFEKLAPDLIWMSPPCQPFTRVGKQRDDQDVRTQSFFHILDVLPKLSKPPRYIMLENVKGFEISQTRNALVETLANCRYGYQEFLLTPKQCGVPNSRLRYYLLAKKLPLKFHFPTSDKIHEDLPDCARPYLTHLAPESDIDKKNDAVKSGSKVESKQSTCLKCTSNLTKDSVDSGDISRTCIKCGECDGKGDGNQAESSGSGDRVAAGAMGCYGDDNQSESSKTCGERFSTGTTDINTIDNDNTVCKAVQALASPQEPYSAKTDFHSSCSEEPMKDTSLHGSNSSKESVIDAYPDSSYRKTTDSHSSCSKETVKDTSPYISGSSKEASEDTGLHISNSSTGSVASPQESYSATTDSHSVSSKEPSEDTGLYVSNSSTGSVASPQESYNATTDSHSICSKQPSGDACRYDHLCRNIGEYLEELSEEELPKFLVPDKFLLKRFWVMDIVFPSTQHSCCFTKRYGHYIEGAGSILQMAQHDVRIDRMKRVGELDENPVDLLRLCKLRFFTPREIANLMCFPPEYSFPPELSTIQCYRLLGNSLNVHVVAVLLQLILLGDN